MLGRISNLTLSFVIIIFYGTFASKFYCVIIRSVSEFKSTTTIFIDDIVNV